MLRNLVSRIVVLLRLAVMVSLAGYTMPNAYAAMHGAIYSGIQVTSAADHHVDSRIQPADPDHTGHSTAHAEADHHGDSGDGPAKQVKKDCCQDFCFSIALPSSWQSAGVVTLSSVLVFADDNRVHGTRPSLHRPPNI
ncbi:hypothetical protein [Rhizobium terrae]|uniref:hypothetical protein n=1 Tax=Rhizobium terrae TaxID=2171756 RepID=UPI000E3CD23F|nr:hypothetical protein [Rhizobium terrae]